MASSSDKSKDAIVWSDIRDRLEFLKNAIDCGFAPGHEEKKKILKDRAKALAISPEGVSERYLEVVEFLLAHERYAIDKTHIREVYPMKAFTHLPCTPPFVLGVINVRGRILSIIDIKKFFNLPEKGLTDLNRVIIVHTYDMEFGILADSVIGVTAIAVDDIQPPLTTLSGIKKEYLRGVTGDRLVVLDVQKILCDGNLVVNEEA